MSCSQSLHEDGGVGWLKVCMFPGAIGIDVARDIDKAIKSLDCERLVIDLRGNTGGGIGCLRLMSYLTPDRVPVGYSVTRRRAEQAFSKEKLPVFDHIPSKKIGLIGLALKFVAPRPVGRHRDREAWKTALPWQGCSARERAFGELVRNGCRVRIGEQACHDCRDKNSRPAARWAFVSRRERIPDRDPGRRVLHVERHFSGGQGRGARRGGAVLRGRDSQWPRCAVAAGNGRGERSCDSLLQKNRIGSPLVAGLSDGERVEAGR